MSDRRHAIALFLSILVSGLVLFSRHSDFAFFYHPDEGGKVQQIIRHKRNFNHPMMMLSTVEVARYATLWGEKRKDPQSVAMVGRRATAFVSAAAAALLALLAFRTFGAAAGWACGIVCVTNPLLYELAHYFKEDPWLMAGIAAVCVALNEYRRDPSVRGLTVFAVACALAAAGKYAGFAFLPIALVLVWRGTEPALRKARLGRFLAVFAGVWLLFNLSFLRSPGALFESVHEETTKLAGLTEGVTRSVPHDFYIMTQSLYGGWMLPGLCIFWLVGAIRSPRRISAAEWLLAVCAVIQFAGYSFMPKAAFRYYLPVSLAFGFLAVAGLARICADLRSRGAVGRLALGFSGALVAVALYFQMESFAVIDRSFKTDDRRNLTEWVRANLPVEAVIAQDEAVNFPDASRWVHAGRAPLPQRLVSGKKELADLGTLADLRAMGVTHVAVCQRTYGRYLDASRKDSKGSNQTAERAFYESLFSKGTILWESKIGPVTYLQPGLRFVDISKL